MPQTSQEVTILLADITGSTPLYENVGDALAARQITECIDRLKSIAGQAGGIFIRSKGDDLLCTFTEATSALRAARLMLSRQSAEPLAIHAGMHFGHIVRVREDLFGDALNLTARLAASAKPGEVLVSRSFLDQLPQRETLSFRVLDNITFKGKNESTEVYSLLEDMQAANTEMFVAGASANRLAARDMVLTLRYRLDSRQIKDRAAILIGRSPDCDLVIGQPWVSRKHATLMVRHDKIQLDDQSSSGTYVTMRGGQELFLRRETILLTGSGIISPARRPTDAGAEPIHYEIVSAGSVG